MSDQDKDHVPQEPYTAESGYSEHISHEQMDPAKELGDDQHHAEHHSSGYSEHGQVVDPTHNVSAGSDASSATEDGVPQEPQQHKTTYSENISDEALDPVTDLGDEEHHPERAETMYSKYAPVTEPTQNADE